MNPDDPRHGTNAGYSAGCRLDCCRHAHMVWMKRYRMVGRGLVPPLGSRRRIEALEAIGWSRAEVSRQLGRTREYIGHALRCEHINQDTADAIAAIYDRLSMVVPTDSPVRRKGETRKHEATRKRAASKGFAPPLAWEDIDDPNEEPDLGGVDDHADPVVVDRLVAGIRLPSTRAEKVEAMSRWLASGRTEGALCTIHGWQQGRYIERKDSAA